MVRNDPYSPEHRYFECRDCNNRVTAERRLADCPDCGSDVQNLAVARE
jgi:Zn finger protein HypA/HybF involved in hydrogenase expression